MMMIDAPSLVGKCWRACQSVSRPVGIVIGVILMLFALFIVVSLILTSIDKLSPSAKAYVLSHKVKQ